MLYIALAALIGLIAGGVAVFLLLEARRKSLESEKRTQAAEKHRIRETIEEFRVRRQKATEALEADKRQWRLRQEQITEEIRVKQQEAAEEIRVRQQKATEALIAEANKLQQREARLKQEETHLEARIISYRDLQAENVILKRDLRNIAVNVSKLELDQEEQRRSQEMLDERSKDLGGRYLRENVKWVAESLTPNNFANAKQRLLTVIERCRGIGYEVSKEEEAALLTDLKAEFEKAVRAAFAREEQARIKAQIREEDARDREIDRELKQLERERAAIQAALDKALAEATDKHTAEIERLRARLAETEEKERAVSQAQLTKAGHVYVISNVGSFGEGVFKIGMTRRLEPFERIKELGDASVPFPFDVHMMISCEHAPALETALHQTLHKCTVNKVNPRKEFFKSDIETIRQIVEKHHGEVSYVADAEALQYRQSLTMSDEDEEYIESVFAKVDKDAGTLADED